MVNIRYNASGENSGRLLDPSGNYINKVLGRENVDEMEHRIGSHRLPPKHIYHVGGKYGGVTLITGKCTNDTPVYADIAGTKEGVQRTRSRLEEGFDIKLTEIIPEGRIKCPPTIRATVSGSPSTVSSRMRQA